MTGRKDFLNQPAPENYVAGLGRGATGFTTRSDLGPAREGPTEDQIKEELAKRAAALGTAPPTAYGVSKRGESAVAAASAARATTQTEERDDRDDDERFQDPENDVGLFASGSYDREDDEADRIYQDVDERMDRRRKARREAREQKEREEYERNNPKIQQQFADLKRALGSITDEDWANIPEVGDLTGKNKRAKANARNKYYAVPDSVLAGAGAAGQFDTSIEAGDGAQGANGSAGSRDAADGTMTNFADIGAARDKVLRVRLDQAAQGSGTDSVAGTSTNIDPKGYLTSLAKSEVSASEIPVGDIKRVRVLLESVIKTNPKHAPGWIAAARLEEHAGKTVAARNVIARGCELCPKNEDIWLENMRMNDNHNAKIIAAKAIKENDRSVRLWIEAMRLENEPRGKKRVLRLALDAIPQSVALWKEAVNLEEDPADAKLMLAKATEIIPLSVELWLALARLESPKEAQVVLNKARKAVPTSHEIWIAAARLQEQMENAPMVLKVMERAIKSLAKESAMLKREEWISEAEKCEDEGAVLTCGAIIRETLGWGLDEDDDRKEIWMDDAKASIGRGKYETARAIYAYTLRVFINRKSIWLAAADLERNHGDITALFELLGKAVEACPNSEVLWMQLAREQWHTGSIDDARRVLGRAFKQNPNNEDIWLAAVKLEAENGQTDKARELLRTARQEAGTDRVWIKSVAFERQQEALHPNDSASANHDASLDLVTQALQLYPTAPKLWMQKGQIYVSRKQFPQAREAYSTGTRACPSSVPLWLLLARLDEQTSSIIRARSALDRARLANPKSPDLWRESVRLERRAGNIPAATALMAQAQQALPDSGMLWAERIWHLEQLKHRRPRSLEAVQRVGNGDPALFVTLARVFWAERKLEKAANWFEKAVLLDADLGDSWAWYVKFLRMHGTEEKVGEVVGRLEAVEPKHGDHWAEVAKEPGNVGKGMKEILGLVIERLE